MPVGLGQGWRIARSGSYKAAWVYLLAATVCGTAGLVINAAAGNPSKLSKHTVLELGGLVLVLWAVAAVLLAFAISRFNRARHAVERDREQAAARQLAAEHLTRARRLAGQLLAGEAPVLGQVWDVVLQPGERVLLDGSVGYSRYYGLGSPATYTHASASHGNVGSGQALLDRAGSRRRAQGVGVAAAVRWRDQQQSRVVVTDRRLLCQVHAKGWVSFDHATTTAIQPVPETRGVVLEYPDTAPVRLSGPVTSQIMVIVVWALYGADGLREHPALSEVRSVAAFPVVPGAAPSHQPGRT
jgi:type II secretory pathway pseudopilin PulG